MTRLSVEPNPRVTFKVRHADEHLLVVEKPAGVVTEPGQGHEHDALLNGLFAVHGPRLQNLGEARGYGLLHRLDKETSGLVAVALTATAYDGMRELFETRAIRKFYWAVCARAPQHGRGVVRTPISERVERVNKWTTRKLARLGDTRDAPGKPALTAYRVVQDSGLAALIEARPVTGRMHQVRLHLESIGAAILGDDLYGPEVVRRAAPRLALHAHRLAFVHPVTGAPIDVRSPWPRDLRELLRRMKLGRPDAAPSAAAEEGGADAE